MIPVVLRFSLSIMLFFGSIFPAIAQSQPFIPPPNSPLAKQRHPRLFFTKESLKDIKNYIDRYEGDNFQKFISDVDMAFSLAPSEKERNYLLLDANSFAFLSYAVSSGMFSNYQFMRSAEDYARKAYDHAVEIDKRRRSGMKEQSHAASFASNEQGGYINLALGVVYDWCYEYLSLSQKQFIADALIYSYQNRDRDTNRGEYIKLGLSISAQSHDVGVGGLALWGDPLGSKYDAIVREMLDAVQWLWIDRVLLMGEHLFEGTAGWSEGANYFGGAATNIIWFTAAISSSMGKNLFMEMNWLHDIPKYLYFYLFPMAVHGEKNGFFEQRNDAVDLRDWDSMGTLQRMTSIAGLIKKDDPAYAGFYRWVAEDSEYKFEQASYDEVDPRVYWLFYKFFWGIKDVTPKTPEQVGLKTSYRFGLGDVILRSDLITQDATKINFYTPKYHLPRHYHKDNGSFNIFKYGTLALDAGVTKGTSEMAKSDRSNTPIYHNLLALYPPGGSPLYNYDMNNNSKADAYFSPDNQPGGRNHVGNVLAMRFEPGLFDFIDYDYTRSYLGDDHVKRMHRELLYIRDPNAPNYTNQEYVLIFDDSEVSDPAILRRWLLHTPSAPEIVDGSWNKKGAGFWTASKGSLIKVSSTLMNAHGRLFLKILAPGSYQLRLRGGSEGDQHYWFVDAEGKDLTERGPFNDWSAFWAGTHRLEIEDTSNDTTSQYLTVMQIGDANTLSEMAETEKIESGDFIGAFINRDRVVFFNRTTTPHDTLTYKIKSSKTVRHYITGLQPGDYAVQKDGKKISKMTVKEDGTLYLEYKGGGNFAIEQTN